ncbi:MAG: L-rhamnose isomerase [Lentisphaeria bacterium]
MSAVNHDFVFAQEQYQEHGVVVDEVLESLEKIAISIHAWQGDDVVGFENTSHVLTGGCQVTGNYPGRARNADELRKDLDQALKLIPGRHRVNLQGHQVDKMLPGVDRDAFTIDNFAGWLAWSKEQQVPLDIAPAFYSHPKLDNGYSLAHQDKGIREFWINHGKAIRKIAQAFGKQQKSASIVNFWAPDGSKDLVADRWAPRQRLIDALDCIFAENIPSQQVADAVEGKLFGIGTESYTVGSHDLYIAYATSRKKLLCIDSGHFHPTESVADKISSLMGFLPKLLLHVSRGVRWDSDHVILLNEDLLQIAQECVRYDYLSRIHIALDYFDASINRVAAWVIGSRNMQKALLISMLEPRRDLLASEKKFNFTRRMAVQEANKTLPWAAVWHQFCSRHDMPLDHQVIKTLETYDRNVLQKRG